MTIKELKEFVNRLPDTFNDYEVENAEYTGGNPFSSPIPIQTNIKNGLGVWGGYGSIYDTIFPKIKKK